MTSLVPLVLLLAALPARGEDAKTEKAAEPKEAAVMQPERTPSSKLTITLDDGKPRT